MPTTSRRQQTHSLVNRYTASYALAILFHLLLLLMMSSPARQLFLDADTVPAPPDPLSFEFVESAAQPSEPPPETRFRSDRDARSADRTTEDLPRNELAYNDGIVDIQGDFETRDASTSPPGASAVDGAREPAADEAASETEQIFKGLESMAFLERRGLMTREQRERSVFGAPSAPRESVAARNLASRALEEGGLQLSTYDWNFAPYLQYLKERIQSHIFPPPAFTRLGIIDGESKVRFRIYPDGRLERLEVLDSQGSELLLKTSTQAVELSAPFKPLPEDFPEPFLEITGLFAYILMKGAR